MGALQGFLTGAAYLFDAATGVQTGKMTIGLGSSNFGKSVAISGTTAALGAPLDEALGTTSGAMNLFDTAGL